MADAAVEFLLNNLKELLVYHTDLISDTKWQMEDLERDLRVLRAFLRESVKKRKKDEGIQMLVQNIRDVVYEVEDTIDAFVTQETEIKSRNYIIKLLKSPVSFYIAKKVKDVIMKTEKARMDFAPSVCVSYQDKDDDKPEDGPPRKKDVVGFGDVAREVISQLTTETDYFDVVSLIGMFGQTTLARKIYNDPDILYQFPTRIWLSISQQFSNKDIFLAILENFTTITDSLRSKNEHDLSQLVADHLDHGKFLIVMDDIWNTNDWDRLGAALPVNNYKGKVLITSREENVGTYASRPRAPKRLRFFTQDESWELLWLEALGQLDCPPDLNNVGKLIARDCKGLPLAIEVIGGILATKYSTSDTGAMKRAWDKVSARLNEHLNENPGDRMHKFVSLSYDKLPHYLRACFLYLGMFPEDYEIPVSKLLCMWIGEGFIQHRKDYTLEETAEIYLDHLIARNLVRIDKVKPDGKVKTCRIHDTLRDFCITEAAKEDFLEEIKC